MNQVTEQACKINKKGKSYLTLLFEFFRYYTIPVRITSRPIIEYR